MSGKSLLHEILERGSIRVTVKWGDTSMQYLDPDTGEPAGFVPLVGQLLARDLGVRAEYIKVPWPDQISAIVDGRADISVKHTNSPSRAFDVEFTIHSLVCEEGRYVVRRDRGLRSDADLNQPGRVIAVSEGSSQALQGREYPPPVQIRTFPTSRAAFEAVAAGEVDACMHDTGVPTFLLEHPECTVLTTDGGQLAVAYIDCVHPCIRSGDPRFLNWLNNWVAFWKPGGIFTRLLEQADREHAAKVERILAKAKEPA